MFTPGVGDFRDLHIDLKNPRVPDEEFASEADAIKYLVDYADVNELIHSIGVSGWIDFEPLIVLEAVNVVIEGNRRLAALKLMDDPNLRSQLSVRLSAEVDTSLVPNQVRVAYVRSRAEARSFIGFKHINGAFKWDSFAKAKYAADWLQEEPDASLRAISQRLGDSHNTVLRLVNGYRVLRQAESWGFRIQEVTASRGFSFSHLYTALPSPTVRSFLGISAEASETLRESPVPESHRGALIEYLTWLYGQQSGGKHVVGSQNPDLARLTKVIGNSSAIAMLRATQDLSEAYDLVEEKGEAFQRAAFSLLKAAREAASQVGKYDGDPEVLQVVDTAGRTVRSMLAGMRLASADSGVDSPGPK